MTQAAVLAELQKLVSAMSLAVYMASTGDLAMDDLWVGLADSCSKIADLASPEDDDAADET